MPDAWDDFNPVAPQGMAPDIGGPQMQPAQAGADPWSAFNPTPAAALSGMGAPAATPTTAAAPDMPFNKDAFGAKFSGPLADKADLIQQTASKYGVPPALASAIIAQETGWGKNVSGNNVAGMMQGSKKIQFGSIEEGIDKGIGNIAKQYERGGRSLEGLQKIYSPIGAKNDPQGLNADWLPGVKKIMGMLQ